MNSKKTQFAAVVTFVIAIGCIAKAGSEQNTSDGEVILNNFKAEIADQAIDDWVGLLECKAAGDSLAIWALEYKKSVHGNCADDTLSLLINLNKGSKELVCGQLDETLCMKAKQVGHIFNPLFQESAGAIPYVHTKVTVNNVNRNRVYMFSPKFFKARGLEATEKLCAQTAKNLSVLNKSAKCISAKK
jgi:hypothetical protein